MIEFTFDSPPSLAKLAARRYIQRRAWFWLALCVEIVIASLVTLFLGYTHWVIIVALVVTAGYLLWWLNYYRISDAAFKAMVDPTVAVRLTDETIEMSSFEHTSKLNWGVLKQVWAFSDVWLLFAYSGDGGYVAIPADVLSDEVKELIKTRVIANGGTFK